MRLRARTLGLALVGAAAGCAVPPPAEQPAAPEIATPAPRAPMADEAERVLRERAEAHEQQRRWADALLQWEMLVLLRPDIADYRERAETTRLRIRETAEKSLALAEQARRSGNLDRALLEYLRVLSVDRDNARAAQGLRDIERERTRRTYMNRPPRIVM
jgi:tetratricopeptide (TPR) repeat protein